MAIINVDGVPVENSTTPAVDGTNARNNIQSFGQLDGGFINALREDDSLIVNTFDADSSGFEVNGNEGDDDVVIDNNVESTDRATGQVSAFTAFGGKGDDVVGIDDLIVGAGSQLFGNIGEDLVFVDSENSIDGLLANGNEDNDFVFIEDAADFDNSEVYGGKGNDTVSAVDIRNVNNVLFSGDLGNDSIAVGVDTLSNSNVVGGDGNDSIEIGIFGRANDNVVNGNTGDDSLIIGGPFGTDFINNEIYGGKDNDTIDTLDAALEGGLVEGNIGEDFLLLGDLDGVAVNGNADDDIVVLDSSVIDSSIWGGQGDDIIGGDSIPISDSVIAGDKGADTIQIVDSGLLGSTVLGGEDDDSIFLGFADNLDTSTATFEGATFADSDSVIDGGAGDDVIAFDGNFVEEATILGGEGADTFQLWNGGTVELTDFEAGTDSLILGDYSFTGSTIGGSTTTFALVSDAVFFNGVQAAGSGLTLSSTSLAVGDKLGASNVDSPLYSGASFDSQIDGIFRLPTNSGTSSSIGGTLQVLFLDNEGSDAGLYVYTLDGSGISYELGTAKALITDNVTVNVNTIALGTFAASDITVI